MKKLLTVIMASIAIVSVNAQSRNVISAYNYGIKPGQTQYEKAKKLIDEAVQHPETKENDKAWYYRGLIYQNIFQSKNPEDQQLHPDPLREAFISYQKSIQFRDKKAKFVKDAITNLKVARTQAFNEGIKQFELKDYEKAAQLFALSAEIGEYEEIDEVELAVYFNAALSYEKANKMDEAIKYYQKSLEKNYEPVASVRKIAEIHLNQGNVDAYVQTLKDGISKVQDNQILMLLLIDHYSKALQYDEALNYLDKTIAAEPNNKVYYFARGTFYDQKGQPDKALESYTKALEIDPKYFDATFNIGVLFFNKGADYNNKANDLPINKEQEYNELREKAMSEFATAAEYFEKCIEMNPTDLYTLKQLKLIYFQLRNKPGYGDKLKAIEQRILEVENK
ncbi:MAG TPA: tetratricopeptide repeat protein [Salinivirgaceae bacterium]|nr:tetratricopeptide repeat protein [Salinivirgaceae bacterium]